jgi:FkbM family methyltransferase
MVISSIIPTIPGRQPLLARSLASLYAQEIPCGIEHEIIISIDSASDSELEEEISAIALSILPANRRGPRIVSRGTLSLSGVAEARNRGIYSAKGDFIYFLDDDDIALPGALLSLYNAITQESAILAAGGYYITREGPNSTELGRAHRSLVGSRVKDLSISNFIPIGSYLIRKTAIKRSFSGSLRSHEDWLFLLDNINEADNVCFVDKYILDVRQSSDRSGGHRNPVAASPQAMRDYILIYGIHPSASFYDQRWNVLRSLAFQCHVLPSIDFAISSGHDAIDMPQLINAKSARYLICNQSETIQRDILRKGVFEPIAVAIAAQVVLAMGSQGVIVDIGANQGAFSIPLSKTVENQIICFEPQRHVYLQLCANILINHAFNIRPLRLAVGCLETQDDFARIPIFDIRDEVYTGSLSLDPSVRAMRSLMKNVAEPWTNARDWELVPAKDLDELLGADQTCFIKVDVEGSELDVLESGAGVIRRDRPCMWVESWRFPENEGRRNQLKEFISHLGYHCIEFGDDIFCYHPSRVPESMIAEALKKAGQRMRLT